MPKYEVKGRLNHDTKDYDTGDTVEMTEEQAAILQPIGIIGDLVTETPATEKGKK